ncbi:DNA (cytosine-5)-methyltransferase 3A-like isoform X1 [Thrips palmi]|uniref:DNA (cytosine-5-)-methyltransferase n=1 Tax=Thrips palmi TaxID=161013 RepID=A0A6P8ZZ08_THRPL|nr:DNA (cytosine-5)-methyltransferase 3A-like isoform X1 [Thrips palmi]XP_034250667.1 DNA (cytosine-5)-methyltransferase 3A-like isoform X1 [Thrips palmi]
MPRKGLKYKKRKRGYRRRLCAPKKGCPRYSGTKKLFASCRADVAGDDDFCGFDVAPLPPKPADEGICMLSLFDGIGTSILALDSIGIPVRKYYSSEVDEKANMVLKFNHSSRITMIGCVTTISNDTLESLDNINLLLGGSPCQQISRANPLRKGLQAPGSSASLFYEYVRIRDHLAKLAKDRNENFFWLFENTFCMDNVTLVEMTRCLGTQPAMRCASGYGSAMKRKRYWWGNIPHLHDLPKSQVEYPNLQDFLMPYRSAGVPLLPTLTSTFHSQLCGKEKSLPVIESNQRAPLLLTEIEELFGVGRHYTDVGISQSDRRRLLGNAWAVPVVVDILKHLKAEFCKATSVD